MKELLVGEWVAVRSGLDLNSMEPLPPGRYLGYVFADGGVAHFRSGQSPTQEQEITWDIEGNDLLLTIPIEPLPEYGIHEWTTDESRSRIVSIDTSKLCLDSRPHGGEAIIEYKRTV
jgi:hypothetical protein